MRISIYLYNGKYIIEMEAGQYRQAFKISEDSVEGLEGVKKLCTPELLNSTLDRFSAMHTDFHKAFHSIQNT